MSLRNERAKGSTSEHLPHKPTREGATAADSGRSLAGQPKEPAGMDTPEHLGRERQEVGDARSSSKHPPHVPHNEEDAPIQDELPSPDAVPVLPANASGVDSVTTGEQDEPVDRESMYDRRPERDKGSAPSRRVENADG
jgi:hypothetical protein